MKDYKAAYKKLAKQLIDQLIADANKAKSDAFLSALGNTLGSPKRKGRSHSRSGKPRASRSERDFDYICPAHHDVLSAAKKHGLLTYCKKWLDKPIGTVNGKEITRRDLAEYETTPKNLSLHI